MTNNRISPVQPVEIINQAEAHKNAGEYDLAEALLHHSIANFPGFDPAYHTLGLIAFEKGDLAKSVELIVQAISIDPANGLYHRNLGELCRRLGRLNEAILAGRRASELNPQDVDTHFNLGLAYSDNGDWLQAATSYSLALTLNSEHGLSWNNLGVALERNKQLTEASNAYAKAASLNPNHAEAHLNLALLFKREGKHHQARQHIEIASAIAPNLVEQMGVSANNTITSIYPPEVSMRDTQTVKGRGVFAERDFLAGEVVEICAVVLLDTPFTDLPIEIQTIAFNWGALCGIGHCHALALGFGSLYNHESPATLRYEADPENLALKFIATQKIDKGKELTINYDAAIGQIAESENSWFQRMGVGTGNLPCATNDPQPGSACSQSSHSQAAEQESSAKPPL
jgi:tetratricopeptide (TPR) repeat protein